MAEEHKVHVGSLSYSTDEDSLKYFFETKIGLEVVDGKWLYEDSRCKHQRWSKVKGTTASKLKLLKFSSVRGFSIQEVVSFLKREGSLNRLLKVLNLSIGVLK